MRSKIKQELCVLFIATMLIGTFATLSSVHATNPTTMAVVPGSIVDTSKAPGSNIIINSTVASVTDMFTWQVKIDFDPTVLNCTNATLPSDNVFAGKSIIPVTPAIDNVGGSVVLGASLIGYPSGITGSGVLCQIGFTVLSRGQTGLNYSTPYGSDTYLLDSNLNEIPSDVNNGYFDNRLAPPSPPRPPVAVFDYSPKPVVVNVAVTFNGSASYDPNGTLVGWAWNFGDTGIGSGSVVTHTYVSAGIYTVNLTVTDSFALTNWTTEQVTVYAFQPANLYIDPALVLNTSMGPSSTFYVNVTLASITSISGCTFNVTYDSQILQMVAIGLFRVQGVYPSWSEQSSPGQSIMVNLTYPQPVNANPAPLVWIRFHVNAYGITPINLTAIVLLDPNGHPLDYISSGSLFANIVRDVAVINVVPTLNWVYQGWIDSINVTVANLGNVSETFSASAWYNGILIGTVPVVGLAPSAQETVIIDWNTTGVLEGNYTISGTASLVPYETYFNTTNNLYVDGLVQIVAVIHDVAVTAVSPSMSWVYAGSVLPINVTVANLGNVSETFDVTANYNSSAIGTISSGSLASNSSEVLAFYWDTTGLAEGFYTISANASVVPFEYNLANNYLADGQVQVMTAIRDVAITNVTTSAPWVYQGMPITVRVTANNTGQVIESFYVTAYYNSSLLGNVSVVNLAPGAGVIEVFTLNTTGLSPCGNYTISGQASIVPFEFNITNNVFVDGVIKIRLVGDINGDGKVDMRDVALAAAAFGTHPGNPRWNPAADITGSVYLVPDGVVDMRDIALIAKNFGKSC